MTRPVGLKTDHLVCFVGGFAAIPKPRRQRHGLWTPSSARAGLDADTPFLQARKESIQLRVTLVTLSLIRIRPEIAAFDYQCNHHSSMSLGFISRGPAEPFG